jgi:hypothetical protein
LIQSSGFDAFVYHTAVLYGAIVTFRICGGELLIVDATDGISPEPDFDPPGNRAISLRQVEEQFREFARLFPQTGAGDTRARLEHWMGVLARSAVARRVLLRGVDACAASGDACAISRERTRASAYFRTHFDAVIPNGAIAPALLMAHPQAIDGTTAVIVEASTADGASFANRGAARSARAPSVARLSPGDRSRAPIATALAGTGQGARQRLAALGVNEAQLAVPVAARTALHDAQKAHALLRPAGAVPAVAPLRVGEVQGVAQRGDVDAHRLSGEGHPVSPSSVIRRDDTAIPVLNDAQPAAHVASVAVTSLRGGAPAGGVGLSAGV